MYMLSCPGVRLALKSVVLMTQCKTTNFTSHFTSCYPDIIHNLLWFFCTFSLVEDIMGVAITCYNTFNNVSHLTVMLTCNYSIPQSVYIPLSGHHMSSPLRPLASKTCRDIPTSLVGRLQAKIRCITKGRLQDKNIFFLYDFFQKLLMDTDTL